MYAVVDIETTGGHASANGITEIAIYLFDGKEITQHYQTLVNPGIPIPYYITTLTGITNEMVAEAPPFEAVAPLVHDLLKDRIFVAHNVNFDYSFVKHQLAQSGFDLQTRKLCTVRLGRKIFPGLPSYSLGNLCRHLGVPLKDRHRAGGDAEATARLFGLLLANDAEKVIASALKVGSKEQFLPANLPPEQVKLLPSGPGVYYFHDQKDKVVYVGKAKNLYKRVNSHFTGHSTSRQRQNFLRNIYRISYQETATELMAAILESVEIKRLWPVFNYAQKRIEYRYGYYLFEDQSGYLRLAIERKRKYSSPVHSFQLLAQGQQLLRSLIRQFGLCPKLCFLQKGEGTCSGITAEICKGACEHKELPEEYNSRVRAAIAFLQEQQPSVTILDKGRNSFERSCILMEKGKFYGMGYVPLAVDTSDEEALKAHLTMYAENETIVSLLRPYANNSRKMSEAPFS
ncbi:DNA polymerase-3 subunit epsilon [Chitinophaga terrae (ex Kim and Jung 2007)]|uniref:exonuclease domain-containing protein n=1 Tax=Chitinophaga terrae (ex Kim and Jung 2007) TaxID=408074 RepID=UPI00278A1BBE|nr:exonuclease domain-containing protein [Chitinophaga terrae (ex Kim and Jung 2007)]MDQ0106420.1 DNA polymerase-3 subunit epsilon [Chitinophaga terrae (ex Kim and Jung 2007)]